MPSLSKPTLSKPSFKLSRPSLNMSFGRRSGGTVVGLDIQPGHVAAVQAHVNGAIVAERAYALPLPADTVREGEVLDEGALSETLRELFGDGKLSKRVRIGVANQRTVLRTLEMPPIADHKELDAAVRFQAQEQVPMPLDNAVMDFHPLGVHDTPDGSRQQVVLVAAQRDMVTRLLSAVRNAGLRPEGIDLSAFALIRSLYRHDPEHDGRVLYLNVDGLTNMAIAEGAVCRFTRVVGGGMEAMASQLAERLNVPVTDARAMIAAADLSVPVEVPAEPVTRDLTEQAPIEQQDSDTTTDPEAATDPKSSATPYAESLEDDMTASQSFAAIAEPIDEPVPSGGTAPDADIHIVLENGIREIAGEVRNSLDFHRSQEGGGEVGLVVLSGAALDVPGFADALQAELGVPVTRETVGVTDGALAGTTLSPQRLAIAAGLAVEEAPR
ncbi:MAG: type IV pilus assembly protein PilM [Solirubrobacteraceae bacterium]|jgi:type IV pilus assembly protein PilM